MTRDLIAASLGLGALLAATGPAFPQTSPICAMRKDVLARLATAYGETRQSIGLGTNDQVVEVFASLETGTWTITVTNPNGLTCLVASGQAFEAVATETVPGDPA
jgi:hypothetical protein